MTARPSVVLHDAESASGLADMLHQFLEQTVEASPAKARAARALRGDVVVRAAEDQDVAVRIVFFGERIELSDLGAAAAPVGAPVIVGDFLSVAHVTSGQSSPLLAVVRRDLRVQSPVARLPFLIRVLAFMRIEEEGAARRRRLQVLAVLAVAVLAACVLVYILRR